MDMDVVMRAEGSPKLGAGMWLGTDPSLLTLAHLCSHCSLLQSECLLSGHVKSG